MAALDSIPDVQQGEDHRSEDNGQRSIELFKGGKQMKEHGFSPVYPDSPEGVYDESGRCNFFVFRKGTTKLSQSNSAVRNCC